MTWRSLVALLPPIRRVPPRFPLVLPPFFLPLDHFFFSTLKNLFVIPFLDIYNLKEYTRNRNERGVRRGSDG